MFSSLVAWLLLSAGITSQAIRTQFDGVYTDAQALRGERLYARHCERCHGRTLEGVPQPIYFVGQSPKTPALIGDEFVANWSELPLRDLVTRVRISMPQDQIGVLFPQQAADVVAFLLYRGNYPSGSLELSGNPRSTDDTVFVR